MIKKKKAQTEIIGLAIIVILLVLGMAFVVRFMLDKEPAGYKRQFTQAEISSNMLNSFLKAKSKDCNGLAMTELLQNCAESRSITCENGMDSCAYVEDAASYIFSQTLEQWNFGYELMAFQEGSPPIFAIGEACPSDKKSKTFPIPTSSGTVSMKLDVCG